MAGGILAAGSAIGSGVDSSFSFEGAWGGEIHTGTRGETTDSMLEVNSFVVEY